MNYGQLSNIQRPFKQYNILTMIIAQLCKMYRTMILNSMRSDQYHTQNQCPPPPGFGFLMQPGEEFRVVGLFQSQKEFKQKEKGGMESKLSYLLKVKSGKERVMCKMIIIRASSPPDQKR